ncbi:D-2-hydroxyacid dehydrogenase [Thalassotalea sediminis]|uniref:D-2-hydroxyacid dehydrogenase n=1 Tax=Thalassotalea sediminis TaxID=1759089 RepID=UPI0025723415|nr:D-2-hydroxyacid dehydrogenase [Thalassotalea sediminis]
MKCVFLDRKTFVDEVSTSSISQQVTALTSYDYTNESDVIARCKDADVVITNKVKLTREILTLLPKLKLICVAATGVNNIDVTAAINLGIAVTNVSGYSAPSVSQYVFSQLLNYFSHPVSHQKNVEQGLWQKSQSFCVHGCGSKELAGKKIAIIGFGCLGQKVANIAQAFDMHVIIAERPNAETIRPNRMAFETALKQADIVSLHCPLTSETQDLINKDTLALMKPSALLINTARGGIINEKDLFTALTQDQIAGAILDVLQDEPPSIDNTLLKNQPNNLKITAHIAWASIEAQQRLLNLIAVNIADFKQGKETNRITSP